VQNTNFPNGNLVMDEVEINLNMLHALMLNRVGRQVDDTDIVTIDKCAMRQRGVQLHEQLEKSTSLCINIGNSLVLCFCARARYRVLPFGGSGDEVVTKEDCIPRSGVASVVAFDPISIRVYHKLGCG
jgi:hypothetical protein